MSLTTDSIPAEPAREAGPTAAEPRLKPWDGKATRADIVLLVAPFAIAALMLGLKPFTPFLLAHHPVLLSLITGSTSAIGAAGAFAKVEGTGLLIPILAGIFGTVKFGWLFWLAGRRWGRGIIEMALPSERMKQAILRAETKRWVGRVGLFVVELPGVPSLAFQLLAGWQRMRFWTFMGLSSLGAALWVGFVALIGYKLGQTGVDMVMLVDKYAVWVSVAIVVGLVLFAKKPQPATVAEPRPAAEATPPKTE